MTVVAPFRPRRRGGDGAVRVSGLLTTDDGPDADEPDADGPDADGKAALPAVDQGERKSRRAERHRRRRRRVLRLAFGVVCAVVLLAGVAASVQVALRGPSEPEAEATAAAVPAAAAPVPTVAAVPDPTPVAAPAPSPALVVQTAGGALQAVTALVVGPSGQGGDVLFLPVGTMVELPAFGLNALREAYGFGGVALLQSSVENLLGVSFAAVAVVDAAGLGQAVGPAGPLVVEVPDAVSVIGLDGRIHVAFASGPVSVVPERVGDLLATPGGGTDLDRLVRHQAFWEAWLVAVAAAPDTAAPPAAALTGVEGAVVALAGGPVRYRVLPVQAVSTGRGADQDVYSVEDELLEGLRADLDPSAGATPRIRVQVLNGTGAVGVSGLVQPRLIPAGARVELSGNADSFGYQQTQVVFYDDDDLGAARTVQEALGVGEVVRSQLDLAVVDVTVVVGADFLAATAGSP